MHSWESRSFVDKVHMVHTCPCRRRSARKIPDGELCSDNFLNKKRRNKSSKIVLIKKKCDKGWTARVGGGSCQTGVTSGYVSSSSIPAQTFSYLWQKLTIYVGQGMFVTSHNGLIYCPL